VSVGQLYRLQQIDSEGDDKSQRQSEIVESLEVPEDLVEARARAAEAELQLHDTKTRMRAIELEVGSLNTKLKANQERMYGGKVRNPKELSGLAEEANSLKRHRSELEDAELDLMLRSETQEADLAAQTALLRQLETDWVEQHGALVAEKQGLEARLLEIQDLRKEVRSRIPRAELAMYDDLRARLGGVAVALLRHGMCQVCGVDLPTAEALAVERGATHFCPVCDRLLCGGG